MERITLIFFLLSVVEFSVVQLMFFDKALRENNTVKSKVGICAVILLGAGIYAYNGCGTIVSTVFLILFPIMQGLLFWIIRQKGMIYLVIWNYYIITLIFLLKLIVLIGEGIYFQKNTIELNYGSRTWIEAGYECFLICFLTILYKWVRKNNVFIKEVCQKFWTGLTASSMTGFGMLSYILINGWEGVDLKILLINISMIVASLFFALIVLLLFVISQMKLQQNLLLMRQDAAKLHYTEIMENYRVICKMNHDIEKERGYLYKCIDKGEIDEARLFLEQKQDLGVNINKVWTGFDYVDFIINTKLRKIHNSGITFQLDTNNFSSFPLENEECCIVLGNLLDNAFDAAVECEKDQKKINLELKQYNNMFRIKIQNSSVKVPIIQDGKFKTSKGDDIRHGWGLLNVENIVKKYDGTIKYDYSDHFFEVAIVFWKIEE